MTNNFYSAEQVAAILMVSKVCANLKTDSDIFKNNATKVTAKAVCLLKSGFLLFFKSFIKIEIKKQYV